MNSLLLCLLLFSIPLANAVKCYYGSQTYNGQYDVPFPPAIDCSDKYCRVESFKTLDGSYKYTYDCGSNPGIDDQRCTGTVNTQYQSSAYGTVSKVCCKGDYCNSSKNLGSLMAIAASFVAIFVNKLV